MTILVVDDEHLIRSIITEILREEGYHVASVTNGMEALIYLRAQAEPPHLILLDLQMPVMTGWQFCEEQGRDPALAKIPVVLMSAALNLDRTAAALQVADCLDKPIEIDRLLNVAARYYDIET